MPDLKPCPFCGGEAELRIDEERYYKAVVLCKKCGIHTVRHHIPSIAASEWNRRCEPRQELEFDYEEEG